MSYIVDIIRRGDEHRTTNLPAIQALNDGGLISRIWISKDSSSYIHLKGPRNFIVKFVDVRSDWMYRWVYSTLLTLSILLKSALASTNVIFLSTTPLHNFLISIFSLLTKRRCIYFVFLHGELSYLAEHKGLGQKLGGFLLNIALGQSLPFNVRHITLAYPIYFQIFKIFKNYNLRNIELPTGEFNNNYAVGKSSKIRIGSFGVHCADKNSHLIYDLARRMERLEHRIEIVTIGVAHEDFHYNQHPLVSHLCKGTTGAKLIDHETFIQQINTLDMALIFYGSSLKYQFISSGIFNDCINYCIPVACLYSQYIDYYMGKHGELGLMRESLDDLAESIISMIDNPAVLHSFKENIRSLNSELSYSNFRRNFLSIINE